MTDESSDVPRELMESIKDVIGRKIKISVRKKVKLEVKGDRVENKVLLSGSPVPNLAQQYLCYTPSSMNVPSGNSDIQG
ncbi:hypothetical protein STEG23_012729 [Scotinomys teguina]